MSPKSRKSGKPAPKNAARGIANKFTLRFGPTVLSELGPLIPAYWRVSLEHENLLAASGQTVPGPISGHILLDTGAHSTCISRAVATGLGLKAVQKMRGFGAGGEHVNDVVFARLGILIQDDRRNLLTNISWNVRAQAIPEMEKHLNGSLINGQPISLIGLLGRDILTYASFIYNGKTGTLEMTFDPAWIRSLQPV